VPAASNDERAALLESLPTSVRKFSAWTSADLPRTWSGKFEAFHRNANKTLRGDSELRTAVEDLLNAVQLAKHKVPAEQRRADRISTLRRQTKLADNLRVIAERELIRLKGQLKRANDERDILRRSLDADRREFGIAIAAAEREIAELVAKVGRGPSNVVRLKRVDRTTRK
jgi:hypothetical protein